MLLILKGKGVRLPLEPVSNSGPKRYCRAGR